MASLTMNGIRAAGTALVVTALLGSPAVAQNERGRNEASSAMSVMPHEGASVPVKVAINKSHVLEFPDRIKRISIGNPEIADIMVVRSRQIYVVGQAIGSTNVVLWGSNNEVQGTLNVEVTQDLEVLKANLHDLLPDESIQVRSSYGTIVLSGQVSSTPHMDAALRLANSYQTTVEGDAAAPVLNLMQVGGAQQVMLDVKVAEVSRTLVKQLNIDFSAFDAGSPWQLGAFNDGAVSSFADATDAIGDAGIFASYSNGDFLFDAVIDAARNEGLAQILAEPNLTTLTGEQAEFLAGGEFPIPVPSGNDQVTVEFKEFGVGLRFLPVVLSSGTINLEVDVAVSDLTNAASIDVGVSNTAQEFSVPGLIKRSASSTVELDSGQTIAIAGMINENLREQANEFPGLADLPIIGQLFRSQSFVKEQTELVIFVTPRLAKATDPAEMRLPTDDFVEPSDAAFYLLGRISNRRPGRADADGAATRQPSRQGGTEGQFGHDLDAQ